MTRCIKCNLIKPLNKEGLCDKCEQDMKKEGKNGKMLEDFRPSGDMTRS